MSGPAQAKWAGPLTEHRSNMTSEEWTADQCADQWGVKRKTWHSYVARGFAPKPGRRIGRTPLWDAAEVRAWPRPGRGTRTDLARQETPPQGGGLPTAE